MAISQTLSDEKPVAGDDDKLSRRDTALLYGGIGLGTGLLLAGHAAYIAVKAADSESEPVISHEVRSGEGPLRSCGESPATSGRLYALIGDRSVDLGAVADGKRVVVLPRVHAAQLCSNLDDLKRSAKFEYILDADATVRISFGSYRLAPCVALTIGKQQLEKAVSLLAKFPEADGVALAVRLLGEATELSRFIPASDPDRGTMIALIESVRASASLRATELFPSLLKKADQTLEGDAAEAVPATIDALALAALTDNAIDSWRRVYQSLVNRAKSRGFAGYALTQEVLKRDASTTNCLELGLCPSWLTTADVRSVLEPAAGTASTDIAASAKRLSSASDAATTQASSKTVRAFDDAIMRTRAMVATCRQGARLLSTQACDDIMQADDRATTTASRQEARFEQVRREDARIERAKRQNAAIQSWRQHFASCKRLADGIRALDSISVCDQNCQKIADRMRQEREKLRSFSVDELVEDASTLAKLRGECRQAACETCP